MGRKRKRGNATKTEEGAGPACGPGDAPDVSPDLTQDVYLNTILEVKILEMLESRKVGATC